MKTFFFCARNIEDYLSPLLAVTEKNLVDLKNKNLIATADVQNLFRSVIKSHFEDESYFDTPIADEIVTGVDGVKLDFNFGLRLEVPQGNWRVKISDFDSGVIFFDKLVSDVRLNSLENYYIHWQVEIYRDGVKVFSHVMDLTGRKVLIVIPKIGMGDIIAALPYVQEMKRRYNCQVSMILPQFLSELAAYLYPDILQEKNVSYKHYATFHIFLPSNILPVWPIDMRNCPMNRITGVALGINTLPQKPMFEPNMAPVTDDPYVCIAVQASVARKGWLYPNGWNIVVSYLKSLGYRVFCIDRDVENADKDLGIIIRKPQAAEDFTGNIPLMERANMLYYAEFFIGLGSGLAWLADAVGCPAVIIAGFSQDWCEFYTPYRVANRLVCNGCFNDVRANYLKDKCPYHEGTERELECQKKISPRQVINAVERLIVDNQLKPPVFS